MLKIRLIHFILFQNIKALLTGTLSFKRFKYSLRKQLLISSLFRDSKYSAVGKKVFVDPFAPHFPSAYFKKTLENNSYDTFPLKPTYAQISITNTCPCQCFHCHVINTSEQDIPKETILNVINEMIEMDFPLIFFVGGEPMSRFDDLIEFVTASKTHMDTRIFTSGVGATYERLQKLKQAGLEGICVSLDHYEKEIHNTQRKNPDAFESACKTIQDASKMGFYVSVVCCTKSSMVASGEIFKVVDFTESLGAHSIQINEIRPVGKADLAGDSNLFLTEQDKQILIEYYKKQNKTNRSISIVMPWYNEEPYKFGCLATTGQKAYIDARGNVQPCELLKVSLGNIKEDTFKAIWDKFLPYCSHPVKECIIYPLKELLNNTEELPVPVDQTYKALPGVCCLETTDVFKKIKVRELRDRSEIHGH